MERLKYIHKFFRILALEEYLNLHNKTKKHTCAKYVVINNMQLNPFYTCAFVRFVTEVSVLIKVFEISVIKLPNHLTVLNHKLCRFQFVFKIEGWRIPKQISVVIFVL